MDAIKGLVDFIARNKAVSVAAAFFVMLCSLVWGSPFASYVSNYLSKIPIHCFLKFIFTFVLLSAFLAVWLAIQIFENRKNSISITMNLLKNMACIRTIKLGFFVSFLHSQ